VEGVKERCDHRNERKTGINRDLPDPKKERADKTRQPLGGSKTSGNGDREEKGDLKLKMPSTSQRHKKSEPGSGWACLHEGSQGPGTGRGS